MSKKKGVRKLPALKPVGRCGVCRKKLYAHFTAADCLGGEHLRPVECPLNDVKSWRQVVKHQGKDKGR